MAKVKQKAAVENMLLAQRMLNDVLQQSPAEDSRQLMLKIQALRAENQTLKEENERLRAQAMPQQEDPRQTELNRMFLMYDSESETEGIDGMEQHRQNPPPSPLNDPMDQGIEYAAAPRDRRIDPTYCPVPRQHSWAQFENTCKLYPEPFNFPLLPAACHKYV